MPTRIKNYFSSIISTIRLAWEAGPVETMLLILCSLIRNIYGPLGMVVTMKMIDWILTAQRAGFAQTSKREFVMYSILLLVIFWSNRIWWPLSSLVNTLTIAKLSNRIRTAIMKKVKDSSLEFFDHEESYNRLELAAREVQGRRPLQMLTTIVNFFSTMISFLILFIPMFRLNPVICVILLASGIPELLQQRKYLKSFSDLEQSSADKVRKMNYIVQLFTNKQSAQELRLFRLFGYLAEKYQSVHERYYADLKAIFRNRMNHGIPVWILTALTASCVYLFFAILASQRSITIGELSFFVGAISTIAGGVSSMGGSVNKTAESNRYMDNLFSFLNEDSAMPSGDQTLDDPTHLVLEFQKVSFRYPGSEIYALKEISFRIELPERVAVVGLNGSGKTTLVKLLTRLYDPTEGVILLNGTDLREYGIHGLRKLYAVCFQDFYTYGFSAQENIGMGHADRMEDLEGIRDAARHSGIHEVIERLPHGYGTCLSKEFDEEATEFSGGQIHKLAIARTFFKDGSILILDEPTAALDAKAERDLFGKFHTLTENKIGIMITHRLSSTINADRILVLEQGELVENGTHEQLMAAPRTYYKLFHTQAQRYIS